MSDSVFRTATEAEAPAEATPAPQAAGNSSAQTKVVSVPDLFVSYEEDQGKPYTAKYFDVENVWKREASLERDIREIDGYVQEQVKKGTVENSTRAAEAFMKELERHAGLTRYESANARITKLLAYIDFKRTVNG